MTPVYVPKDPYQLGLQDGRRQGEARIVALEAHVRRLEEAGGEMARMLSFSIGHDEDELWACSLISANLERCEKSMIEWTKAKESNP